MFIYLRSRTAIGIYAAIMGIFLIIFGVVDAVKQNGDKPDFNTLLKSDFSDGMLVSGKINSDNVIGKCGYRSSDSYYFIMLESGNIITFMTSDKNQKSILEIIENTGSYAPEENCIELDGMVSNLDTDERDSIIEMLVEDGYMNRIEAEKLIVPYKLVNHSSAIATICPAIGVIMLLIAVILLLPKIKILFGISGKRAPEQIKPSTAYNGFYTGTSGNSNDINNPFSGDSTYGNSNNNTYSNDINNPFSGDSAYGNGNNNTYSSDINNSFSGDNAYGNGNNNTYSNDINNPFSGDSTYGNVNNNTYSNDINNPFSGDSAYGNGNNNTYSNDINNPFSGDSAYGNGNNNTTDSLIHSSVSRSDTADSNNSENIENSKQNNNDPYSYIRKF